MNDPNFRRFLEIALKLHQIFALVDVDYAAAFPSGSSIERRTRAGSHLAELAEQLAKHGGLNYAPREISKSGRVFEHAADSRVLIDHLAQLDEQSSVGLTATASLGAESIMYYVQIVDDLYSKDGKTDDPQSLTDTRAADRQRQQLQAELHIKADDILLSINKPFIQLTMKANGKADLYFHAYFWEQYLRSLMDLQSPGDPGRVDIFSDEYPFMRKVVGLSATLSKVIVNIKKFPFHEKMYHKYATEFG